jgi:hypothetical protein
MGMYRSIAPSALLFVLLSACVQRERIQAAASSGPSMEALRVAVVNDLINTAGIGDGEAWFWSDRANNRPAYDPGFVFANVSCRHFFARSVCRFDMTRRHLRRARDGQLLDRTIVSSCSATLTAPQGTQPWRVHRFRPEEGEVHSTSSLRCRERSAR